MFSELLGIRVLVVYLSSYMFFIIPALGLIIGAVTGRFTPGVGVALGIPCRTGLQCRGTFPCHSYWLDSRQY